MAFQNRSSAPIGRDENFVHFEFLEGKFYKGKTSFVNLRKNLAFFWSFPSHVCVLEFSGVFLT